MSINRLPLIILLLMFTALSMAESHQSAEGQPPADKPVIPANVQEVLDRSCMPCHGGDASNFKAKARLNFGKLWDLEQVKIINKLNKIGDEVKDGDMPKKGFVKKHPEAALTPEQSELLIRWADNAATEAAN